MRTIKKADAIIREVNNGSRERHYFDASERNLIVHLKTKPMDYEISEEENHCLNKIREKIK